MNESHPHLEQYPDAIQDLEKARVMATASHGKEEELVSERAQVLEAASNIGYDFYRDVNNSSPTYAIQDHLALAKKARNSADAQAELAGAAYDEVTKL